VASVEGNNLVVFYYLIASESCLIREVLFGGCDFIRGVVFGGCGLIRGVAFDWCVLIRRVAFGGCGLIRGGLLYIHKVTVYIIGI
jgi:hypothetical protein